MEEEDTRVEEEEAVGIYVTKHDFQTSLSILIYSLFSYSVLMIDMQHCFVF